MGALTERVAGEERDTKVEERRKQILDAAETLIAQKGYHGTTMDDIVRESRLSKGTLYWYFKSKKEIILALMERRLQISKLQMQLLFEGKTTFAEKMRAIFDYSTDTGSCDSSDDTRVREMLLNTEFWRQAIIDPEVNAKLSEVYLWQTELGENLVREAVEKGELGEVDATALTDVVIAVLDGISLRWLINRSDMNMPRAAETFLKLIFKGLDLKTAEGAPLSH